MLRFIQRLRKEVALSRKFNYIDMSIPIDKASYVVIDLELTGLNPQKDSIVSIGAVKMDGDRIRLGDFFYRIINTDLCHKESILIHGITPSESSLCPEIEKILPEFLHYCGNRIIVGHFVSIDVSFINKELKRLFNKVIKNPVLDTIRIYKWLTRRKIKADAFYEGKSEGKTLFDLARELDINIVEFHNALYDAFITAQIFQRYIHFLKSEGIVSLGDLLRIGGER
ncbi:MAG: 3'-5' exonuclease [Thermodesulfovibrionales bacterium]|nr:3'-5' exonuclease [Thermodesulfovibrionales bacterium]